MAKPSGLDKLKSKPVEVRIVAPDNGVVGKDPGRGESDEDEEEFEKYELEDAVRTLEKAAEIKADKKLMKALGPYLDKKVAAVKSLSDLRKLSGKKAKEEAAEEAG